MTLSPQLFDKLMLETRDALVSLGLWQSNVDISSTPEIVRPQWPVPFAVVHRNGDIEHQPLSGYIIQHTINLGISVFADNIDPQWTLQGMDPMTNEGTSEGVNFMQMSIVKAFVSQTALPSADFSWVPVSGQPVLADPQNPTESFWVATSTLRIRKKEEVL